MKWMLTMIASLFLLGTPIDLVKAQGIETIDRSSVDVRSDISKSRIQVVEPTVWTIQLTAPKGVRVAFPPVADQIDSLMVVDSQDTFDFPSPSGDGQRHWVRRLTLESLQPGDIQLNPVQILVSDSTSSWTVETEPISLRVTSVLEDQADPGRFKDLRDNIDAQIDDSRSMAWIWSTIGGAASVFLLAFIAWAVRRKPSITAESWAKLQIARLQESDQDRNATVIQLARIVRQYIDYQFDLDTAALASDELSTQLQDHGYLGPEEQRNLDWLLSTADLTSFAGSSVTTDQLDHAFEVSGKLVQSKPLPNSTSMNAGPINGGGS